MEERDLVDRGGDRRREVGGNEEGGFEVPGGHVLAELYGWQEMALPKKGNNPDLP